MSRYVVCDCCGRMIVATSTDLGRAVICPTSRQLVFVTPENLCGTDEPPTQTVPPSKRGRWAVAALLLLLLGVAVWLAWNRYGSRIHEVAQADTTGQQTTPSGDS